MCRKNSVYELIQRAQKAEAEAIKLRPCNAMEPLRGDEINIVEKELCVTFSDDFKEINQTFNYEYIGCFDFPSFYYKGRSGVVSKTQQARREFHLPPRYVILSDMGDAGSILIETQDRPQKSSPVIWCDMFPDFFNLCEGKPMEQKPTIWPSFTDFFEYLVEQEEAKLKDDA